MFGGASARGLFSSSSLVPVSARCIRFLGSTGLCVHPGQRSLPSRGAAVAGPIRPVGRRGGEALTLFLTHRRHKASPHIVSCESHTHTTGSPSAPYFRTISLSLGAHAAAEQHACVREQTPSRHQNALHIWANWHLHPQTGNAPPTSVGAPQRPLAGPMRSVSPRDVLEGGRGFGWDPPSSQGPPVVPAEGGPKLLRLQSSWHRRRRRKILAVSLTHWKGRGER